MNTNKAVRLRDYPPALKQNQSGVLLNIDSPPAQQNILSEHNSSIPVSNLKQSTTRRQNLKNQKSKHKNNKNFQSPPPFSDLLRNKSDYPINQHDSDNMSSSSSLLSPNTRKTLKDQKDFYRQQGYNRYKFSLELKFYKKDGKNKKITFTKTNRNRNDSRSRSRSVSPDYRYPPNKTNSQNKYQNQCTLSQVSYNPLHLQQHQQPKQQQPFLQLQKNTNLNQKLKQPDRIRRRSSSGSSDGYPQDKTNSQNNYLNQYTRSQLSFNPPQQQQQQPFLQLQQNTNLNQKLKQPDLTRSRSRSGSPDYGYHQDKTNSQNNYLNQYTRSQLSFNPPQHQQPKQQQQHHF